MSAELFEWVAQIGSWQPSGMGLVLGGVGLAAASNAAHLPRLASGEVAEGSVIAPEPARKDVDTQKDVGSQKPLSVAEQSKQDGISFKVRSPWR